MTRLGGFGFLDDFHCEKVSFLTFGAFAVFIVLAIMLVANDQLPTSSVFGLFDPPISLLLIAGVFTLGGYLGVLYYRITNNKRPLFIIQFWNAEG